MRLSTGVKRLDELLDGGVPAGSSTLLYGPPFAGKDTLAKLFVLEGLRDGVPAVYVVTDTTSFDLRAELTLLDEEYPSYEKDGLVRYVDTYSRSVGATDANEYTEYVDGAVNLNAVSMAVNNAQRHLIGEHTHHRLVINSVSTLLAYTNAQTVFRFLQVFLGKAKRASATTVLDLAAGMHPEPDVEMVRHLVDGVICVQTNKHAHELKVEGIGSASRHGWLEYHFNEQTFDLTGSFSAGRIR